MDADFSLVFSDYQDVQALLVKMRKDCLAISSCLEVISGYHNLVDVLGRVNDNLPDPSITLSIQSLQGYFRDHLRGMETLLADVGGVSHVLVQILAYRNQEALIHTSENIRKIAETSKYESQTISMILKNTRQDSRTVKALSIVAVIYLPVSLVTAIFSTGLIEYGQPSESGAIHVSKNFWLLPVLSLAMLIVTYAIMRGVARFWLPT